MGVDDFKGWIDLLTSAGFLGVAWYLLKWALPEKDRQHADERKAWQSAMEKLAETARLDAKDRADKYERLLADVHDRMASLSKGDK